MPQRTAFIIPGGAQTPTTGYSSTSQQIQSFLIPQQSQAHQQQHQQKPQQQQQSASHSLFLDHLVTLVPSTNVNAKQKPVSSAILKLDDGPITGKYKFPSSKKKKEEKKYLINYWRLCEQQRSCSLYIVSRLCGFTPEKFNLISYSLDAPVKDFRGAKYKF